MWWWSILALCYCTKSQQTWSTLKISLVDCTQCKDPIEEWRSWFPYKEIADVFSHVNVVFAKFKKEVTKSLPPKSCKHVHLSHNHSCMDDLAAICTEMGQWTIVHIPCQVQACLLCQRHQQLCVHKLDVSSPSLTTPSSQIIASWTCSATRSSKATVLNPCPTSPLSLQHWIIDCASSSSPWLNFNSKRHWFLIFPCLIVSHVSLNTKDFY